MPEAQSAEKPVRLLSIESSKDRDGGRVHICTWVLSVNVESTTCSNCVKKGDGTVVKRGSKTERSHVAAERI